MIEALVAPGHVGTNAYYQMVKPVVGGILSGTVVVYLLLLGF